MKIKVIWPNCSIKIIVNTAARRFYGGSLFSAKPFQRRQLIRLLLFKLPIYIHLKTTLLFCHLRHQHWQQKERGQFEMFRQMHQYIQGSSIIFAPVEQNLKQLNGEIRKGTNTIISFLNRCVTFVFSFWVQKMLVAFKIEARTQTWSTLLWTFLESFEVWKELKECWRGLSYFCRAQFIWPPPI